MGKHKAEMHMITWEAPGLSRPERRSARREAQKEAARLRKQWNRDSGQNNVKGLARRTFAAGGEARARNLRASGLISRPEVREASTFTLAGAFPWVSQSGLGTVRGFIGMVTEGGGMWCVDPWECYNRGLITGMSCVLIGTVGTGKSTTTKAWVKRMVQAGRRAVIMSDPKAEWVIVAKGLAPDGVDPEITIGVPGKVINPLDPGKRPATNQSGDALDDHEWVRMVRSRRASVMKTIVQVLSKQRMSGDENLALTQAIAAAAAAKGEDLASMTPQTPIAQAAVISPTIPDVIHHLYNPSEEDAEVTQGAGRSVANQLRQLVDGDLAGLFDGPSTVAMNEDLPMIVFNTRPLGELSVEARKIASHCVSSWAESVFTNRDSGQRIAVYEEGWENMDDEPALERMVRQWKLARDYGLFNILILHKLKDLFRAGDEGSRARELAMSLLADTDIRVVHRQKSDQLAATGEMLRLTASEQEEISRAPKGQALWKIGEQEGRMVKTIRSKLEGELFDTDHAMAAA
ncbi:hypothetical protein FCK90_08605 [Kocuria coralli]|uniref:ATP-binding protein n=1 Tax=Kocuria coralli TaxID=1461025 RepID=A0A5J5KWL9_9MICC|nr:hypothetical protein [Kocuria coralli]KAA9394167.1 hypothetical protein FCK90_08605 [Kocuria coralli]